MVSWWLSDVTDVVGALFDAGLATSEHVSLFFGDSSLVSNTLWTLKMPKLRRNQPSTVLKKMTKALGTKAAV